MAETTEQIIREDPAIEAFKVGLLERAKGVSEVPITLPTQKVADLSGLQQAAIQQQQAGIGGFQPFIDAGAQTLGQALPLYAAGTGAPTQQQLDAYMNPFQQAIQDEINRSFDIQQIGARDLATKAGAFGGSRGQISLNEIDRNRASALAQAQAQNFLQAQQGVQNQFQRDLAAAQGIGTLGLQQAALGETQQKLGQSEAEVLFNLGTQQQNQQQRLLDADKQNQMAQLFEPYQRLSFLSDIYKGAPSSQQTISTATSPQVSPAQQFIGTGIAGLSAAAGASKAGLFG
mgnify:FL=1|jgi:hypothetical protein